MKRKRLYGILLITFLMILVMLCKGSRLFGSTTDWYNQHVVFADFFRLLASTGTMSSSLAVQLGAGMNLFHLSYYGLFNPLLYGSLLVPFLDMSFYLSFLNLLLYFISCYLCYRFLQFHTSPSISLAGSILFACASPVLFHFHRQYMFVNYFPFLFLAFFAIQKKRGWLLSLSMFLIILTSYFFAFPCLVSIVLYYLYIRKKKDSFDKEFFYSIVSGCLLSGFMVIPTFFALLDGARGISSNVILISLFLPNPTFWTSLYNPYGLGMGIIFLFSLFLALFRGKKKERRLSIVLICLSCFSLFVYLFNGLLYTRSKALIPFLPLAILLCVVMIKDWQESRKLRPYQFVIFFVIVFISYFVVYRTSSYGNLMLVDFVLFLIGLLSFWKWNKKEILLGAVCLSACISVLAVNLEESYLPTDVLKTDEDVRTLVQSEERELPYRSINLLDPQYSLNQVYASDYWSSNIYSSTSNSYYDAFLPDVWKYDFTFANHLMVGPSRSVLFQTLMGERYLVGDLEGEYPGYQFQSSLDELGYFENEQVLPMFYTTNTVYSRNSFDISSYGSQIASLFSGVIAEEGELLPVVEELSVTDVLGLDTEYTIAFTEDTSFEIPVLEGSNDDAFILSFDVNEDACSNDSGKVITINGMSNLVACKDYLYSGHHTHFAYHLLNNEQKFSVTMSAGEYTISNIRLWKISMNDVTRFVRSVGHPSDFQMNGNEMSFEISSDDDGYLVSTLPYDRNYRILIDGKEVETEIVNTAFLGAPISAGTHQVTIVYQDSGIVLGVICSVTGVILLGFIIISKGMKYNENQKFKKRGPKKIKA